MKRLTILFLFLSFACNVFANNSLSCAGYALERGDLLIKVFNVETSALSFTRMRESLEAQLSALVLNATIEFNMGNIAKHDKLMKDIDRVNNDMGAIDNKLIGVQAQSEVLSSVETEIKSKYNGMLCDEYVPIEAELVGECNKNESLQYTTGCKIVKYQSTGEIGINTTQVQQKSI